MPRPGLMYLLNELGNPLIVLRPEPGGTLTEVQAVSTLPPGFDGDSHTAHLGMSADGRCLYVSNRGHDSLTAFTVGPGGLVFDIDPHGRLHAPSQVTVPPPGLHRPWRYPGLASRPGRTTAAQNHIGRP